MKIIYSLDTNTMGNRISPFFCRMAELSVFSSHKTGLPIVLYTDEFGYQQLKAFSNCKFDDVILCDWYTTPHSGLIWNFCKLQTYAMQNEDFIHIDFDVFLRENFSVPKAKGIYTEKKRLYNMCDAFKDCAISEREPLKLVCSGLLGSVGKTDVWERLFEQAKELCRKDFMLNPSVEHLIGMEEYCLSQIVEENCVSVHELNPLSFLHFQGANKQKNWGVMIDELYNCYVRPQKTKRNGNK